MLNWICFGLALVAAAICEIFCREGGILMYIYTALFILLAFVAGLVIGFAMGIDSHWDRRDR